jgi:hypothetical protein
MLLLLIYSLYVNTTIGNTHKISYMYIENSNKHI